MKGDFYMQQTLNQILNEILRGDIIRYVIIGTTVLAVLFKVIESFIYIGLLKQAENIPNSKNKLIKQMKLKYENCYKLNLGVNNVNAFVDKYMHKHKVCGISMHSFVRLPLMIMLFNAILGVASGVLCYMMGLSDRVGALYEIYGAASVGLILLSGILLDTGYKRRLVRISLVEFFDNSFANHLGHDAVEAAAVTQNAGAADYEQDGQDQALSDRVLAGEMSGGRRQEDLLSSSGLRENKSKSSKEEDQAVIEEVLSQFFS